MLRLDVGTQAFSAAVVSLAVALVIASYRVSRRQDGYWGAFALSAALYGLAALPVILIGSIPISVVVLGVNPMSMLAALAFHAGAIRLDGRPLPWGAYLGIFISFSLGQAAYHTIEDSLNARTALISLARCPIFLHAAILIHAAIRKHPTGGGRLLAGTAMGWTLLLALRGLDALFAEGPIHDIAGLSGLQAFYFLAAGLGNVLMAVALLRMDTDTAVTRMASAAAESVARSEADLRAILDNMTDVFYRTDREGRLLMLSRSVETVLGYPVAEILGTKATGYHVDAQNRDALLDVMMAQGGTVTDYEFQMRRKDATLVWVSVSSRILLDAHGQSAGTEGVLRLIEERKRTETRLRESQSLIRAMLNASADAIMLLEADGTLLAVNDVTAGRFGRSADELAGTSLWDLFPPKVAEARRQACQAVLASGQPTHTLDRRGDRFLDNSIYPVTGYDGISNKLAVYSRDITTQKLAEARIADYVAEVERSNAELEQYAYVASHDLREPLRMISSYLQLLERRYADRLDTNGMEFLGFARDGAQRMDRLVLDLLELSRVGRHGSPIVPMSVLPAVEVAIRHLDPTIIECGARVTILPSAQPPRVMGDSGQVARLFQNLIANALKYRAADRAAEIRISCTPVEGAWEFHVADNGIGIAPEYFEKIFRIFQRLHTRDRYEGTGIGLAICRKIVERHEGRIWVESTPDQGSTFSFTLKSAV